MDNRKERINAIIELGEFFRAFCEIDKKEEMDEWSSKLEDVISLANHKNGWFTKENIVYALDNWGVLLTKKKLEQWLSRYNLKNSKPKTVALIMAGNIPLVGFHDFLSVLLSGNKVLIKLSSNDAILLPFIADFLKKQSSVFENAIEFTEGKLDHFDAVIATGSDNTARYFEHYFGNKPNVIRKNRNSVAVLTGKESTEELNALGEDIFRYYGLGCRSVSKVFVPKGYEFKKFFEAIFDFNPIINQVKYANNYDYNKAVYLMSEFNILENGFLMLKEDKSYSSPIATLFYEEYDELNKLKQHLLTDKKKIQCVVGNGILEDEIKFGKTQKPSLTDYADGVDTVEFLLKT
ncbi:acyl-CoA reductase [Maribacter sp. HTCC2170]|uniref:acyl-CoA reductase n=1 Tax=Maribacter sp. (strain HTCC2170 / KCCM 42371) TaxID=313603 RepID=UPI00006AFDCC|nr:acyl-CoA reductase [Maribacter sp. HTCC2170]EAR01191.1 hypothetical protein FB2170_10741 [Maribacter sp. HTCC2170]